MTIKINFHSVFEAAKAADLFNWPRHHNYGSLEFDITEDQIKILKQRRIRFWYE